MPAMYTKECTQVYFALPCQDHKPEFTRKRVDTIKHFSQRVFRFEERFQDDQVREALFLQRNLLEQKSSKNTNNILSKKERSFSRKDQVNRKRKLIKQCIENRSHINIAEIGRVAKADRATVKRVVKELAEYGEISEYEYNNVKTKEEEDALNRTIEEESEGFMTVSLVKRKLPMFSKKKILKAFHDSSMRYRLMPKERKNPIIRIIDSTNVCRVISHIAQAMTDPNTTLLYCDEMKFPLFQTAEKRWIHKDCLPQEMMVYNRRPALDYNLNVIALCSLEKFEAIQVYQREVTGQDFLYFLNNAISQMPPGRHYTIITDNAGWHHANVVSRAEASRFLCFNEPRLFQLNIIENAFSFIRHLFRHRPMVNTLSEEAKLIVDIFFDEDNPERFKGLVRNHLKVLLEFLEKHKPK